MTGEFLDANGAVLGLLTAEAFSYRRSDRSPLPPLYGQPSSGPKRLLMRQNDFLQPNIADKFSVGGIKDLTVERKHLRSDHASLARASGAPHPPPKVRGFRWALRHPNKAFRLASNWLHGWSRRAPESSPFRSATEWRPRAPEATVSGWTVLLAGDAPPSSDEQSSLSLKTLIDTLRSQRRPMVFASRLPRSELPRGLSAGTGRGRWEAALQAAGVSGFAYGLDEAGEMMAALGPNLRYAFLSSTQVAHDFIPCVRSHCPTATIIYDMADFHDMHTAGEASLKQDAEPAVSAAKIDAMALAALRAADITIVRSSKEKSALLDLVPTAVIEVVPDFSAPKVMDLFHV